MFDVGSLGQTGWGGFTQAGTEGSISVDVARVDEVVDRDDPIALLKIDAEGADTWVLEGCEHLLRASAIREVWYEQNRPRMEALGIPLNAAGEYLRRVGYQSFPETDPDLDVVEWRALPA